MKASKLLLPAFCFFLLVQNAAAGKEVDRLLSDYAKIETVTCQVRRIKEGELGKLKFLSRVYYTNKDQIHAEGISPFRRRTIADGKTLHQYVDGNPKGFSRPIQELSEDMLISLRLVPGTAMEHLLRLKGLDEKVLPATAGAAKQIGIQADTKYVALSFDEEDRLTHIDFYTSAAMKTKIAEYLYSGFVEAAPGVWIPLSQKSQVFDGDSPLKETVNFDRFIANKPIAESLFIASSFFDKKVDFVDDFAKIYDE